MYLQLSLLPSRFFLVSLKFQFLVMHQKENSSLGVSIYKLASKFTSTGYIHVPVNMHACLQAEYLVEELECYNLGDLINIRSNLPSQIYVDIRSPTIYIYICIYWRCDHGFMWSSKPYKSLAFCWVVRVVIKCRQPA